MKWNILNKLKAESKELKVEEIVKLLLNNRGLKTKKQVDEFLNPKHPEKFTVKDLGLDKKEIQRAVKRIKKAIKNQEGVIVYGDYDADGICATAILWETLYKLTKNVLPYIPERVSEGYGLNTESIKNLKLKIKNLGLIITVDHGITAAEKIQYAKELGIDVIVCDHHQMGKEKPKCSAIVHTEKTCATAISWFLSSKIQNTKYKIQNDLDLVAIATIADLEPLIGVNRSFAKYGMEVLNKTKRCGLLAIFEEAVIKGRQIGTYEVGYIIAPRLNAMGRMEHALESLRLLCTKDKVKAKNLADKLGLTNRERQALTEETVKQAKLLVAGMEGELPKFLVIDSDQYEEGIIGLVAGKLVEEFHRPAIVVAKGEVYSKASARSINGFNIIEAIRAQSDLLVDAGGHPMAAGFTIETAKLEIMKERLKKLVEVRLPVEILEKTLRIDTEIPLSGVSLKLWEQIQRLQPFGLGNPEPVFMSKVMVRDFRTVGKEGKHLKLILWERQSDKVSKLQRISAIGFGMGHLVRELPQHQSRRIGGTVRGFASDNREKPRALARGGSQSDKEMEVVYNIASNEWNGEKIIELKLKGIK